MDKCLDFMATSVSVTVPTRKWEKHQKIPVKKKILAHSNLHFRNEAPHYLTVELESTSQ